MSFPLGFSEQHFLLQAASPLEAQTNDYCSQWGFP